MSKRLFWSEVEPFFHLLETLLLLELCSKRLFWSEVEPCLGLEKIDQRPTFSIIATNSLFHATFYEPE